ncbi:MAG: hypothetical protein RJA99_3127 [Pseudomonadota bacterium]|jgi:hypothetical protein
MATTKAPAKRTRSGPKLGPKREVNASKTSLRLVVLNAGSLSGRKLYSMRIKPEVMEALDAVLSGPRYIAIEWAITEAVERLKKLPKGEMVMLEGGD